MEKLKVLELFGGIGACTKALKNMGVPFEVVDYVEIDEHAVKSYNAINGTNFIQQDITKWNKQIEVDLIIHESPCQDFSICGLGKGGDEGSGTRSSLMYETLRIIEKLKPKYIIWENVKNVLSKTHIHNFKAYLNYLQRLGYANFYSILNACDYGTPQKRERIFTISIQNGLNKSFLFPIKQELTKTLKDYLQNNIQFKYYATNGIIKEIKTEKQVGALTIGVKKYDKVVCIGGIGEKIPNSTQYSMQRRIYKGDITTAITTGYAPFYAFNNEKNIIEIRKLTPLECWRLMGFTDEDFCKASKYNSNSQLYKQAGNSIVVNVLEAILMELFKERIIKNDNENGKS